MSTYKVQFFWGDYTDRQRSANAAEAICYIEHHFNSSVVTAHGTEVIVGSNSGTTSRNWAALYAAKVSAAIGTDVRSPGTKGVIVGGYSGRGDGNLRSTKMPAILVEPCFVSNPAEAAIVKSEEGQNKLAKALADSIREMFPDGGLVAFSVGHKGKESNPHDMGAAVYGGGTEAEYAEIVLNKAKALLGVETEEVPATPAVVTQGDSLSDREQMAAYIIGFEARRDSAGHLAVYKLPKGDGGGTFEVAGINDKYDPKASYRLRDMIQSGHYNEAEIYAREYIAGMTDVVRSWFINALGGDTSENYPGIEFFLRDTTFNRGANGCAKILQHALGVKADGAVGTLTRGAFQQALILDWKKLLKTLRETREWYERAVVGRDESSIFWKGLVNRWNGAYNKALSFS